MTYTRTTNGLTIEWEPDNETAASRAVEDVTGVTPDNQPATLGTDTETAAQIRERYEDIVTNG